MQHHSLGAAIVSCVLASLAATPAFAEITAEDAIRIAREAGVATIDDVDRDDGRWDVEGRDADGREIEVDIDAASGEVIKVERN